MRARKSNPWRGRGLDKRQARRARRRAGVWQNAIARWESAWTDEAWEITPAKGPILQELLGTLVAARDSNTGDLIAVGFDAGRDTPEDPDS